MIFDSMTQLIGHTPLLEPKNLEKALELPARLLLKLEYLNPAGSVKDRVGYSMILDAEKRGLLQPGAVIIEPTSGNTGIGLAAVAASRGYHCVLVMPDTMSVERRNILKAYGAEIVLTPGPLGMKGAVDKAEALSAEIPGSWVAGQFSNQANADAHRTGTGPELWEQTEGSVDIFVAGAGTGGTITGTGEYLKSRKPGVRIVAVEPATSPLLSKGYAGPHQLQGIGANFVPEVLNRAVIDEILPVENEAAFAMAKMLARCEGILNGITAGAALSAAVELARRPENKGKTIVALLPDSGDRYYSTPLFLENE